MDKIRKIKVEELINNTIEVIKEGKKGNLMKIAYSLFAGAYINLEIEKENNHI